MVEQKLRVIEACSTTEQVPPAAVGVAENTLHCASPVVLAEHRSQW